MYAHVGSCRNFYQPPVGPAVLSVVATCSLGWSHSGDLAYLRVVLVCWAWWWLFLPCWKRVAAAQRCLRRVRCAGLCMWLWWFPELYCACLVLIQTFSELHRWLS